MENIVLLFLIVIATLTEAYMPAIKIYEIRKTKDSDIDDQYYDMSFLNRNSNDNKNVKLETLVRNIIVKLQNLSKRSGDDDDEDDFIDKTRSLPLFVYNRKPRPNDLFQTLLASGLRSQFNDVEDRTAPPRHGPLEYDY